MSFIFSFIQIIRINKLFMNISIYIWILFAPYTSIFLIINSILTFSLSLFLQLTSFWDVSQTASAPVRKPVSMHVAQILVIAVPTPSVTWLITIRLASVSPVIQEIRSSAVANVSSTKTKIKNQNELFFKLNNKILKFIFLFLCLRSPMRVRRWVPIRGSLSRGSLHKSLPSGQRVRDKRRVLRQESSLVVSLRSWLLWQSRSTLRARGMLERRRVSAKSWMQKSTLCRSLRGTLTVRAKRTVLRAKSFTILSLSGRSSSWGSILVLRAYTTERWARVSQGCRLSE